ncbi:MAG: NAD-dependent epimerase/dehydratase family protein [Myxococcota bacterium]
MSRKRVVLVTGARGEMGTGLVERLAQRGDTQILALDLQPLDPGVARLCRASIAGDILDGRLMERLQSEFEIDVIYHLAAILSTRAEFSPRIAHDVNVQGTLNLLDLAVEQSRWHGREVRFLFPSSIAAYGLPSLETKRTAGRIDEDQFNTPTTMYGCNKLSCEHLGRYYARHYRQLARDDRPKGVDFRAIRFPGLISAVTVPSGGTSDFAPEMLHAAARGEPYACFVREDTRIPFMAMPDAVDALLGLGEAPSEALQRPVYNIGAFAPTALEVAEKVRAAFPSAEMSFAPDEPRQRIVDTWPEDVDDGHARAEWGLAPRYDWDRCFDEYLIPGIRKRYAEGR